MSQSFPSPGTHMPAASGRRATSAFPLVASALLALSCSADSGKLSGNPNDPFTAGRSGTGSGGSSTTGGGGQGGSGANVGSGLFGGLMNAPNPGGFPSSGPEGSNCGLVKLGLDKVPAELLLVQDRSGSMREMAPNAAGRSKWDEVTAAVGDVIGQTQASIFWGLTLYPMPPGSSCGVPTQAQVEPALNSASAITAAFTQFSSQTGRGGTPTSGAVKFATSYMQSRTTTNPKFMLLATDGLPNCKTGQGGRGDADQDPDGAVAAVAAAAAAGFPTFVVGIALDATAGETLNRMAEAGGKPRTGATEKYYAVNNRDDLVAALGAIAGQVGSCTFQLAGEPPDPANVVVDVGGMRVPQSPTDGWSFGAGNRSVTLNGSWCDKVKNGDVKDAQITFGCAGIPIP